MVNIAQSLILGAVQGIFEWLPISSEGVVALFSQFFKLNLNPVSIGLFLHSGTFLAVLIYFRKDWQQIFTLKRPELLQFLLLTTLISLAVGYPLYHAVKQASFGALLLLITGFGLLLTAFFHRKKKSARLSVSNANKQNTFNFKDRKLSAGVGFLQGLSVIPGVSRSAVTIFGLSLKNAQPQEVLKISYLLSAPVGLASSVYLFWQNPRLLTEGWLALLTSFLVGVLSLRFILSIARKINFFKFAFAFGLLCLLGAFLGFFLI